MSRKRFKERKFKKKKKTEERKKRTRKIQKEKQGKVTKAKDTTAVAKKTQEKIPKVLYKQKKYQIGTKNFCMQ